MRFKWRIKKNSENPAKKMNQDKHKDDPGDCDCGPECECGVQRQRQRK